MFHVQQNGITEITMPKVQINTLVEGELFKFYLDEDEPEYVVSFVDHLNKTVLYKDLVKRRLRSSYYYTLVYTPPYLFTQLKLF